MTHVLRTAVAVAAIGVAALPAVASAAPAGYTRINTQPIPAPVGASTPGQVTCPSGTVVWGGGAGYTEGIPDAGNDINTSSPTGTGWRALFNNRGIRPAQFQVNAVCAKQPPGYTFAFSSVAIAPGRQTNTTATCPPGTVVLSGGTSSTSSSPEATELSAYPVATNRFRGVMANETSSSLQLNVFAMCAAKPIGYTITSQTGTDMGGPVDALGGAQCPGRSVVIGGGIKVLHPRPLVTLGDSLDEPKTQWESLVVNLDSAPATVTTFAICAS
jgi:hypothetical protein